MKPSSFSSGVSRTSGSSLSTIFPSRSASFRAIAVQLKRKSPQLRLIDYYPTQSDAPIKNSPPAITVVPGSAQRLNWVKADGSQPKTIAPATRMPMEIYVFNACKSSTDDTRISLQRRDYFVAETVTECQETGGLPSRSSPRVHGRVKDVRLRQGYGATVYVLDLRCERRLEPRGFEPLTSSMPLRRSTN